MSQYVYPRKMTPEDYKREDFKLWYTKMINECRVKNQEEWNRLSKIWNEALVSIAAIWGRDSRQYKYVKREGIPIPPGLDTIEKNAFNAYNRWLKKQARKSPVIEKKTVKKIVETSVEEEKGPRIGIYDDSMTRNF